MSQLHAPSGLCFLECGCVSSPSPFPGLLHAELWHDAGFRAPRLRLGSGRGQAGLAQGSAQLPASLSHMDMHPVPFLSAAWRGAVSVSLCKLGAARASGSAECIIPFVSCQPCIPPFPSQRPCVSQASPLGLGAEMLAPGEGCSGAWLLPWPLVLGHGIVGGCAWQSEHKEEVSKGRGILPLAARFPSCSWLSLFATFYLQPRETVSPSFCKQAVIAT